jgi:hypothetical protein
MTLLGAAALLGWYDIAPGAEPEHQDWYLREHIPERLALPGFRAARRYRRAEPATANALPAWFTLYETDDLAALASPEYLARLDDPTPLTRRLAPTAIRSRRSAANLIAATGDAHGGHLVATPLVACGPVAPLDGALARATARGALLAAQVYCSADDVTARKASSAEAAVVTSATAPAWALLTEGHEPVSDATAALLAELGTLGLRAGAGWASTEYRLVYARAAERASARPAA